MTAMREYKNSLFVELFNDPERLLSLYNALTNSNLPPETPIEIATLQNVVFHGIRNDLAFLLGDTIVFLIEHQATISENMPLRILLYLSRILEAMYDKDAVYKQSLVKIPRPEFVVLYNGEAAYPGEMTLKLSDAFKEAPPEYHSFGSYLELTVRVLNINEGQNADIVKQSEELFGYVRVVSMIRANVNAGMLLTEAVTKAVNECISQGILAEFLRENSKEVINMLTEEWSLERAVVVGREEGREEGEKIGIRKGADLFLPVATDLRTGFSVATIAEKYQVSISYVEKVQASLEKLLQNP
jgi:hypothetical protein